MSLRYLAFTTFLLVAASTTALAQEGGGDGDEAAEDAQQMMTDESALDDQAAREFFSSGRNLYDLGRYHEAAEQFQQAYDLSQRATLLYNLYLAHRDATEEREAAAALRLYLERMEEVENRQALQVRLENLERAIAEEDAERDAAAVQAEEAVRAEQAEREREEAEQSARAEDDQSIAPWVIAGSGAAILIGGIITGALAMGLSSDLEASCTENPDGSWTCPDDQDLRDKQSTLSVMAPMTDVLLIGGGIIAAVGLTWGILQLMGGDDDEEAPQVAAMCGPTGCGASVRVGF